MVITDKLTAIANKIRSYTKKENTMKLDKMPTEIEVVYNVGINDEHLHFWDNYTNTGKRENCRYMFAEAMWTDEIFNPPYTLYPTDARYMFQNTGIKKITADKVDFSKCNSLRDVFYNANSLSALKELELKIKNTATFAGNNFTNCIGLTNLTIIGTIGGSGFDVSDCTKLSLNSIHSILQACNKADSSLTITLPSSIEEAEDLEQVCNTEGSPVNEVYLAAIASGYTISFN